MFEFARMCKIKNIAFSADSHVSASFYIYRDAFFRIR